MTDDVDFANDISEKNRENKILQIRERAEIAPGVAGECDSCGEYSPRLIHGNCARCRDLKGLP